MKFRAFFLSCLLIPGLALAGTVSYELEIGEIQVNFTGEVSTALAINGQVPAPLIEAREGDLLRVTFVNTLDRSATIHWHGILLPPDQDGVPYLNTQPIAAGTTFTYEFPIIHNGTFWYHSHTDLQIQRGLYGPIVLHPPGNVDMEMQDEVVVFSDWNDEDAESVFDNLKMDDDYYAYKKDMVQSWDKVISFGDASIRNRINQTYTRMPPMDLADVAYDAFLANGRHESTIPLDVAADQQLRLRLVNGSTSSYFDVEYAGGPMTIVSADGQPVEPIRVQRLRIPTAETYDVIVPAGAGRALEMRATSIDGTGYSSVFIGEGERVAAPDMPPPNFFLMDHDAMTMDHDMEMEGEMDMPAQEPMANDHSESGHDMNAMGEVIPHMTDYQYLRALQSTELPNQQPWREVVLNLSGNMERYVWSFNGLSLREAEPILIRQGENVRMTLVNETMMNHPLHLHGHFFRVITPQGERSPLKHTVNVPPMGVVVIEFSASEQQDWLFHCHNQYHMKSGMSRVISYTDSTNVDDQMYADIQPYKRWFTRTDLDGLTNYTFLNASVSDERNQFHLEFDADFEHEYEATLTYDFHLNRFASVFVGVEAKEHDHFASDTLALVGFNYLLPFMIESEFRVDDTGEVRLELDSELHLTKNYVFDWQWNTDEEYRLSLRYSLSERWGFILTHDSNYGGGLGLHYLF